MSYILCPLPGEMTSNNNTTPFIKAFNKLKDASVLIKRGVTLLDEGTVELENAYYAMLKPKNQLVQIPDEKDIIFLIKAMQLAITFRGKNKMVEGDYFEVHFEKISYGAVGMGPLQFNKNQNIGEMVGSFVYASNWKLFSNGKQNKKYQSVFGSNDVIGCGLKKSKGLIKKCLPGDDFRIFWTLNGAKLDYSCSIKDVDNLYPIVSIFGEDSKVVVNFGTKEFLFKK
uniref:B30.2/SPRY domain-containing protein n=1 Tax=Meloidogyne javanica TaxID=6303 RepID=A0A915N0Z0_MELJA